jgi:hypothetical protein
MRVTVSQVFVMAILALPNPAQAGAELAAAGGGVSASARLDFQITIPRVMSLQVGPGLDKPANATISDHGETASVPGQPRRSVMATSIRIPNGLVTARVAGHRMALALTAAARGPSGTGGPVIYTASVP